MHKRWVARFTLVVVTIAGFLLPAAAAVAKSYWISDAEVSVVVVDDGSLDVIEHITFNFSGAFSGAYRDIPLKEGQFISLVTVSDDTGAAYQPGGCTELGCSSPPGTYGIEALPDRIRVVWHHDSQDESRTFTLTYKLEGVAVAYDDIVDVNMRVWGDQWPVGVDRLTAHVALPDDPAPGSVRVWGHPIDIEGETTLGPDGVSPTLTASNIPPERWVEIRTVFPTEVLTSTAGATVVAGNGLDQILQEEKDFANYAAEASRNTGIGAIVGALLALLISIGAGLFAFLRYGKEPEVDYDREYEQEPPTDLTPAEVGALLSQGKVAEKEFTATLFDLIRKGAVDTQPTEVVKSTWGGLRKETITDLELSLGTRTTGLTDFERSAMTIVERVLADGPQPLTEFRDRIRDDADKNAKAYKFFKENVLDAVTRKKLLDIRGTSASTMLVIGIGVVVGIVFIVLPKLVGDKPGGAELAALVIGGMILGTVLLAGFLFFRKVRNKRTPAGALEAARWDAFRRYLTDFSRLQEAPAISLALWDKLLVYAIGFGVATEVLEQARLNAPPELEQSSSLFWYGTYGYSGGSTENAFVGIESALSGAFTPPGSGGGFSAGGGGGFGGGGGGAW